MQRNPTFATWIQKRRHVRREYPQLKPSPPSPSLITFVEAFVEEPSESVLPDGLEVHIPHGAKLMIRSHREVGLAAQLIRTLEGC